VPFSLLAVLGAGSDERTQTPLGAHQSVQLSQVKENTAFDRTDLRFLYCTENSHEYFHQFKSSILVNIAQHQFIRVVSLAQVVRTHLENRRGLTRSRRAEMERFSSGLSPVMSQILYIFEK
jgi:hypothetical protein